MFTGSIIINLYAGHIEFISLGGLVRGLSLEAIFMGVSQSRNPNLAAVFYRMKLIESYGTGVRKIKRLYAGTGSAPEFKTAEGAFAVIMYNRNEASFNTEEQGSDGIGRSNITVQADEVYEYIESCKRVTRKEIENKFGFGATKAYNLLKQLCAENKIIQQKQGNQTCYSIQSFHK